MVISTNYKLYVFDDMLQLSATVEVIKKANNMNMVCVYVVGEL